jgi:hypothetical protein
MTRTPNACFNVYTIDVASIALAITRIDAEHSDARSPRHCVIASLDNRTTLMTRTLASRFNAVPLRHFVTASSDDGKRGMTRLLCVVHSLLPSLHSLLSEKQAIIGGGDRNPDSHSLPAR